MAITYTPEPPTGADARRRTEAVEETLDRLAGYDFLDGPGMATHGPMAGEALVDLGHHDLAPSWVEAYKDRHAPIAAPPAQERLDPGDVAGWRSALGDPTRLADWEQLFGRLLDEQAWPEVLAAWVPRLLAGYGGAFTHGLLRTAHAVRALAVAGDGTPSPLLLRELAKALAYWAGTYKVLPGRAALNGDRTLAEAIAQLPVPAEEWTPMEAGQFSRLDELPAFPEAVEALRPPDSVDQALSDLTVTFARLMLANPDVHPFGLVHAITPVAGVRTLLPYLPSVSTEEVYAQLWQVDAAIACGFAHVRRPDAGPSSDRTPPTPPTPEQLTERAATHRDPHVVKFTDACLRENAIRPDPVYLLAAAHVAERTTPW